jgi:predicted DNA-binding transcriptional regulator YafY
MGKISNVFSMLELLSNGRKYSVKELSERLEVTERMVRLYKEELEMSGIYIDTIRGPYGGYILNESIRLPKRGFSKYDIELLENIYALINSGHDFRLKTEYLDLLDKVKGIYKGSKIKSARELLISSDETDKYNILNRAIKEKRKIWINFLLLDGETRDRIIHPCNMFVYNDSWYVGAFCELRGEIRHFRLGRIMDLKLLEEKYD